MEARQKLRAAEIEASRIEIEVLVLKSQLESLEYQGKKMVRRELLSIEVMEQLESQSEVQDVSELSGFAAPVEIPDHLSDFLNSVSSDWSSSQLLNSNDGGLLPDQYKF
jgi:hypothetical protein